MMKVWVYDKRQKPIPMRMVDVEKMPPLATEVEIALKATSVNAADYRSVQMGIARKGKVLGCAVSGEVLSVGSQAHRFKKGDQVIGDLSDNGFGAWAERLNVPENLLVLKGENTSYEDAAALPVAATTALRGLKTQGQPLTSGQQVLVVGSSGGVGSFAVQLAVYFGARVTTVCSERGLEQALLLGAEKAIDYTKEDFTQVPDRFNRILAINGGYPLLAYKRLLKKDGICLIVGGKLSQLFKALFLCPFMSIGKKKIKTLSAKADQSDLAMVSNLLDNKEIQVLKEEIFEFDELDKAFEYVAKGHAKSKVIVQLDNGRED